MNFKTRLLFKSLVLFACLWRQSLAAAPDSSSRRLIITPVAKSGIYELGESAGWDVALADESTGNLTYSYEIKKNNFDVIKSGVVDLSKGRSSISVRLNEPAMLYATLLPKDQPNGGEKYILGAAVAPFQIQPCAPRP